jgi:hypothetical protein
MRVILYVRFLFTVSSVEIFSYGAAKERTVKLSNKSNTFVDLRSQQYLWFNVYYLHYMFRPLSVAILR